MAGSPDTISRTRVPVTRAPYRRPRLEPVIVVNIHEAKTRLSQLLAQVEAREVVIIARAGKPVARLCPAQALDGRRNFGRDRGLYAVPDDFDEPFPEELLEQFFT